MKVQLKKSSILPRMLSAILLVMLISGCNYQVKKSLDGGAGIAANKGEATIAFDEVYTRVFKAYCTKCHTDFANYANVMEDVVPGNSAASPLFARLKNNVGGDMPGKGNPMIPDAAAALIRDWIDSGAPEKLSKEPAQPTGPTPQPTPVSGPEPVVTPTFTDLEVKVFSKKCTTCHSNIEKAAGFSLENYDDLVSNARLIVAGDSSKSGIFISVSGNVPYMPPKRAVAAGFTKVLTDDEKGALKAWIDAGALRN
jgi:cytochrome c5